MSFEKKFAIQSMSKTKWRPSNQRPRGKFHLKERSNFFKEKILFFELYALTNFY